MAKLIAQSGHSLDLPRRRVTLGESSVCDIPLAGGLGLAPTHFEIEPNAEGQYVIRDISGGGGMLVNGEPALERALQHGNVIAAGGLQLGFWNTDVPQETESPFLAGAPAPDESLAASPVQAPLLPVPEAAVAALVETLPPASLSDE